MWHFCVRIDIIKNIIPQEAQYHGYMSPIPPKEAKHFISNVILKTSNGLVTLILAELFTTFVRKPAFEIYSFEFAISKTWIHLIPLMNFDNNSDIIGNFYLFQYSIMLFYSKTIKSMKQILKDIFFWGQGCIFLSLPKKHIAANWILIKS